MFRIIILFCILLTSLSSHVFQPAYLEIKTQPNNHYLFQWKVPLIEEKEVNIQPKFPLDCQSSNSYKVHDEGVIIYYFSMDCKESLLGRNIIFTNIEKGMTDVLIHVKNQKEYLHRLTSTHGIFTLDEELSPLKLILDYTLLGVEHILIGFDHLLFVLGLLLLIHRKKELLFTITAFTVAHSITLGLNSLGYLHVDTPFIEFCIALSIVILSIEIIYTYYGQIGLSSKFPWTVAFLFGLIHGFGFASVLEELGLPSEHFLLALGFFNLGIEMGQLSFIALLLIVYFSLKKYFSIILWSKGKLVTAYLIGTLATYWLVERVLILL